MRPADPSRSHEAADLVAPRPSGGGFVTSPRRTSEHRTIPTKGETKQLDRVITEEWPHD
jgi:hypothetical protein